MVPWVASSSSGCVSTWRAGSWSVRSDERAGAGTRLRDRRGRSVRPGLVVPRGDDVQPGRTAGRELGAASGMAQGPFAGRTDLRGDPRTGARQPAAHRLRERPVSQHRRVLVGRDGHGDDPGRRLHAVVRLLRGEDRAAAGARPGRAGAGGGGDRDHGPGPRGHHLGRPR